MITGVCMAKDEVDVIGATLKRMVPQVDELVVLDNGSTDGTRDILSQYPIRVIDDPRPGHRWSECVTRMSREARDRGAEWIVPFDADEVWVTGPPLRSILTEHAARVVNVPILDHVLTPETTADPEPDPIVRMKWRRKAYTLKRVAFRPIGDFTVMDGGHGIRYAGETGWQFGDGLEQVAVHHFPVRSFQQFEIKARRSAEAMKDPNLTPGDSTHWSRYARALEHGSLAALYENEHLCDPRSLVWDPIP